jgi:aryl-alcohol dehydrogenase-like predicted oxidoreductase
MAYCGINQIGIIAYSPMQAGMLSGKFTKERAADLPESDWRSRHPFFIEPQLSVNLNAIEQLRKIANEKNISMSQLSLAWVLRNKEVTSAIVGARNPKQIEETAKAGDMSLSITEIEAIEQILLWRINNL